MNPSGGAPIGRLRTALHALWPAPVRIDARERARAWLGAALGVLFTALVSQAFAGRDAGAAWLIAPIGASAVLVFALPASPLAQPWAVLGGNTLSSLIGIGCALWIPSATLGAAAVGLAIGAMTMLRCLHPPGGAVALLAVLGHTSDPGFALYPVLLDSGLLVLAGVVYNSLTGRRYPHAQTALPTAPATAAAGSRFSAADLDAALAHYNQVLDISRDDLEALLHDAELASWRRTLGELRCADIMSRELVTVEFGTPLKEAWAAMRERRVKALPVVDRSRRIVGIVATADFMRHAELEAHPRLGRRLRTLLTPSGRVHSEKPEVVGQIMTRQVRVASADRLVVELVPLFSEGGHHHIPIVDGEQRLAGIITQSDLVRVLYRAARPD